MSDDLIAPTRCACSWAADDTPEKPCGCGQHTVSLYREAWHWRGQHWTATCLIAALAAQGDADAAAPPQHALAPCGHVIAATYGTKGCQLPICAGDREDALQREAV